MLNAKNAEEEEEGRGGRDWERKRKEKGRKKGRE